jgi:LPS sulfotransferase NodH
MKTGKFCVLSTARCGSTALCSVLRQCPNVVCHREVFSRKSIGMAHRPSLNLPHTIADRDRDPIGFLAEIERRSFEHAEVFGFKLLLPQNEVVLQHVLASHDYRIVLLSRSNQLAQYSSLCIAATSGAWHARKNAPTGQAPLVHFDGSRFQEFLREMTSRHDAVGAELQHRSEPHFALEYLDLTNAGVISDLLDFVGGIARGPVPDLIRTIPQVKQNTARILDRFSNPEDVVTAMRHMDREDWLLEEARPSDGAGTRGGVPA